MSRSDRDRTDADGSIALWDFATPGEAAKAAVDVYGSDAVTAAAHCALAAHFDGRERDYRLWLKVFLQLKGEAPAGLVQ